MNKNVKFISYDGKFPCLCTGTLTVEINGKTVTFGTRYCSHKPKADHKIFWYSGGNVWFDKDYSEHVESGPWKFNINEIPEEYQEYAEELCNVFQKNVPQGCCGGCV